MSEVRVGSIMCFYAGAGGAAGCTPNGEFVMCTNIIPSGFAKITKIEKQWDGKYAVQADHVLHDIYKHMPYKEALKLFPHLGYKVGLDRIFLDASGNEHHQVFAYHPETHGCVLFSTSGEANWKGGASITHCSVFLPGFSPENMYGTCVMKADPFDGIFGQAGMEGKPLHWMAHVLEEWKKNGTTLRWQRSRIPDMRTYTEEQEDDLAFSAKVLSQATEECISIFKGCTGYDAILSDKEEIKNG